MGKDPAGWTENATNVARMKCLGEPDAGAVSAEEAYHVAKDMAMLEYKSCIETGVKEAIRSQRGYPITSKEVIQCESNAKNKFKVTGGRGNDYERAIREARIKYASDKGVAC